MAKDIKTLVRASLKRRRPKRNQEWLARQVGISRGHLSLILSRKRGPSLNVAANLEAVTGIPAREFAQNV